MEFFKILFGKKLGEKGAWDNRNNIYLAAAACAEFTADIFLCPFEVMMTMVIMIMTLMTTMMISGLPYSPGVRPYLRLRYGRLRQAPHV